VTMCQVYWRTGCVDRQVTDVNRIGLALELAPGLLGVKATAQKVLDAMPESVAIGADGPRECAQRWSGVPAQAPERPVASVHRSV
jgi:hypothetical protein